VRCNTLPFPKGMSRHGKISDSKTHLSVIMPKEVKADLKLLAANDGRSLSNYIVHFLEHFAAERMKKATKNPAQKRPVNRVVRGSAQKKLHHGPT